MAALTTLPVIGVPIKSSNSIGGLDSLLSIVQMPEGVPAAAMATNGAVNAGVLAAQIIAISDKAVARKLVDYKKTLENKVVTSAKAVETKGYKAIIASQ